MANRIDEWRARFSSDSQGGALAELEERIAALEESKSALDEAAKSKSQGRLFVSGGSSRLSQPIRPGSVLFRVRDPNSLRSEAAKELSILKRQQKQQQ